MSWDDTDREDTTIYKVVVNHEEQYSIWPADRENSHREAFKEQIDRGYVHITFTGIGGAEPGVRLDKDSTGLSGADFERQTGHASLERSRSTT